MDKTSEVLLSRTLSSLTRHHREASFFLFLSILCTSGANDGKAPFSGSASAIRGAEVGGFDFRNERDRANDEREDLEDDRCEPEREGAAGDDARDSGGSGDSGRGVIISSRLESNEDGVGLLCLLYTP